MTLDHSKNIEVIAKSAIGNQTIMPIDRKEFKEWQEKLDEEDEGFYWGNIFKESGKKEVDQLTKFKPRMIVSFYLGEVAYDIHGNVNPDLRPIYFTVKKNTLYEEKK